MPQQPPDPARRQWLGRTRNAAAAASALAVLGPVASAPALPAAAAPAKPQDAPGGYHETEHTRRYYQLARF